MTPLVFHVDGGSRGNPGPAGYGVVVSGPDGQAIARLHAGVGIQTNNYAEYSGLIAALEYARDHGATEVQVFADSELMVRQMQGRYAVKSENLRALYQRALALSRALPRFRIEHVRRAHNQEADRLANQAMDAVK